MAVRPAVTVRRLEPEDAAAVVALSQTLRPWFDATGLERIARDVEIQEGFVAMQEGRLVGFVTWAPLARDVADLTWMGVAGDLQRQGIGTGLVTRLAAELRARGFQSLDVSTVADNVDYEPYDRTRKFYRATGFTDLRVDGNYWGSGDDRYDRLVLRYDLRRTPEAAGTKPDAIPQNGAHPGGQAQAVFKTP